MRDPLGVDRLLYLSPPTSFKLAVKFPERAKLNPLQNPLLTLAVDLEKLLIRSLNVHLSIPLYRFVLMSLFSLLDYPILTLISFCLQNCRI